MRLIDNQPLLFLAIVGLLQGCANENRCPRPLLTEIVGQLTNVNDTATVTHLASECIPIAEPAVQTAVLKRGPRTRYEIASTATITYSSHDIFRSLLRDSLQQGSLLFEAVTQSGVVLGSDTIPLWVGATGNQVVLSAQIGGLAPEEVGRIKEVRVRWK